MRQSVATNHEHNSASACIATYTVSLSPDPPSSDLEGTRDGMERGWIDMMFLIFWSNLT